MLWSCTTPGVAKPAHFWHLTHVQLKSELAKWGLFWELSETSLLSLLSSWVHFLMFCHVQIYTPGVLLWVLASNKAKLSVNHFILTFQIETKSRPEIFKRQSAEYWQPGFQPGPFSSCQLEGQRQAFLTCTDAETCLLCAVPHPHKTTQNHTTSCSFFQE